MDVILHNITVTSVSLNNVRQIASRLVARTFQTLPTYILHAEQCLEFYETLSVNLLVQLTCTNRVNLYGSRIAIDM